MAEIDDDIGPVRPSAPQHGPEGSKPAHKSAQKSPAGPKGEHTRIPALRPTDIRRMLRHSGHTQVDLSRFMGRSRNYVNEKLASGDIPLRMVEALYLMLGHDMFWTAYEVVTPHPP
jgi:hypothetical protein